MRIFGISFILFFLKLSDGSGYWLNLRNSDEETYRQAVKVQRINKKLLRCELAIKFLTRCRDTGVFPKFTRWKNANSKHIQSRNKYRRKVLREGAPRSSESAERNPSGIHSHWDKSRTQDPYKVSPKHRIQHRTIITRHPHGKQFRFR